ncbi:hypothetical protein RND81_12G068000 [Saponaria officinalis]|uniref:Uncharacterized protein n=1 Tax=Saponaria officinalis TaxID=3572 RepID=A0AAW1H7H1_SAPOF
MPSIFRNISSSDPNYFRYPIGLNFGYPNLFGSDIKKSNFRIRISDSKAQIGSDIRSVLCLKIKACLLLGDKERVREIENPPLIPPNISKFISHLTLMILNSLSPLPHTNTPNYPVHTFITTTTNTQLAPLPPQSPPPPPPPPYTTLVTDSPHPSSLPPPSPLLATTSTTAITFTILAVAPFTTTTTVAVFTVC